MTPDAIKILAPVPIVPMDAHIMSAITSPELVVWVPSIRDIPAVLLSPAFTASGTLEDSRKQNSVLSG